MPMLLATVYAYCFILYKPILPSETKITLHSTGYPTRRIKVLSPERGTCNSTLSNYRNVW